jgi:hypothetical protein
LVAQTAARDVDAKHLGRVRYEQITRPFCHRRASMEHGVLRGERADSGAPLRIRQTYEDGA